MTDRMPPFPSPPSRPQNNVTPGSALAAIAQHFPGSLPLPLVASKVCCGGLGNLLG